MDLRGSRPQALRCWQDAMNANEYLERWSYSYPGIPVNDGFAKGHHWSPKPCKYTRGPTYIGRRSGRDGLQRVDARWRSFPASSQPIRKQASFSKEESRLVCFPSHSSQTLTGSLTGSLEHLKKRYVVAVKPQNTVYVCRVTQRSPTVSP